jgi:hypothetical protein
MVCGVCRSPDRARFDRALVTGQEPLRDRAGQYGLSSSAVHRHRQRCLPDELVQAHLAVLALGAEGCLLEVERLRRRAQQLLDQALSDGDHRTALAAMAQCRGSLDLLIRTRLAQTAIQRSGPGPYDCCIAYAREHIGNLLSEALVRAGPAPPAMPDELLEDAQ